MKCPEHGSSLVPLTDDLGLCADPGGHGSSAIAPVALYRLNRARRGGMFVERVFNIDALALAAEFRTVAEERVRTRERGQPVTDRMRTALASFPAIGRPDRFLVSADVMETWRAEVADLLYVDETAIAGPVIFGLPVEVDEELGPGSIALDGGISASARLTGGQETEEPNDGKVQADPG